MMMMMTTSRRSERQKSRGCRQVVSGCWAVMASGGVNGQHVLLWSVCVFCLLPPVLVNAQCSKFEFPTAHSQSTDQAGLETFRVDVPELQTATIPFSFQNCTDSSSQILAVSVSKMVGNTAFKAQCKMYVQGKRYFGQEKCSLSFDKGNFSWSRRVSRSDAAVWRWKATFNGAEANAHVYLNVTYPPSITRLSKGMLSPTVKPRSLVNLVCSYKEGNPDVLPFIKDAKGRKLEVQGENPGEVTHTINDVSCDDTGSFSCEAPGAVKKRTMMLLVQCPLRFRESKRIRRQFVVDVDEAARLDFQIRSHTKRFSACWLSPWRDQEEGASHDTASEKTNCSMYISAEGTPPDMSLIFEVRRMASANRGTWLLNVSNDAGSDDVTFAISFRTVPGTQTPPPSSGIVVSPGRTSPTTRRPFLLPEPAPGPGNDDDNSNHDDDDSASVAGVAIASIVAIIIIIGIISIIAFFLTKRYGGRMHSVCRLCTRPGRDEATQESLQDPDNRIYFVPDTGRGGTGSGAGRGAVTGSHLYEGLQIALPPNHDYEDPKDPVYSQPGPASPANVYSPLSSGAAPPHLPPKGASFCATESA